MKIELLKEPKLEFGNDFICDDPKKGLSIGGFFSSTNQQHRSEIRYSVIGTKKNIQDLTDWIKTLENNIEAKEKVFIGNETEIKDGEVSDLTSPSETDEDVESGAMIQLLLDIDIESIDADQPQETFIINKKLNPDF